MLLPLLAVVGSIVSLCIGSSYAKQLFLHIGAEGTTVFRVGFAALILLAVWRPWRWPLRPEELRNILLYGLCLGAMNLLFYKGIATIPIGIAIAIEFTGPLTVATFSSRKLTDFVWIGFALLGMFLLSPFAGGAAASLDPGGVVCILMAANAWGLYILIGKKAGESHGGQVTSLGLLVASMVALPFGGTQAYQGVFHLDYVLIGCMVAIMSSAIPYSLELYALRRLPKQTFSVLLSLEPAVGALTGLVILKEQLTVMQWLAIASIIVASVGSSLTADKAKPAVFADDEMPVLN